MAERGCFYVHSSLDNPIVCLPEAKAIGKKRNTKFNLRGILNYVEKTFRLFDVFRKLPDSRGPNKTIPLADAVGAVFMMLLLQYRSMDSFFNAPISMKESLAHCSLKLGCKLKLSRSSAERLLAEVDPDILRQKLWQVARKARRNKVFANSRIDGYTVGIIDGIQTFSSDRKKCDAHCLTAHHKNGTETYSHKLVVLSTPCIGGTGHMVLNYTFLKAGDPTSKDEGEITGMKRLLSEVDKNLKGLVGIYTGDALYANAPCINAIRRTGAAAIVRIKGDNRKLIREADQQFDAGKGTMKSFKGKTRRGEYWVVTATYDEFEMPGVAEPVRLVRFTEIPILKNGCLDTRRDSQGRFLREERTAYMLCTDLSIEITTIWKVMHVRWDIEDACFHVLSTDCHIKHLYSHKAAEQIIALMLLAFNMRELYLFRHRARDFVGRGYRQIDYVKRLEYDLHNQSIAEMLAFSP